MSRHMRIALKLSHFGQHPTFKMAAVVVKGGAVLSTGVNAGWHHAEHRALKPHRDLTGATIYVARNNGGISKPCDDCMAKIIKAGISNIVYTNRARQTVLERI